MSYHKRYNYSYCEPEELQIKRYYDEKKKNRHESTGALYGAIIGFIIGACIYGWIGLIIGLIAGCIAGGAIGSVSGSIAIDSN